MKGREALRRTVHVGLGAGAFLLPVVGWLPMAALCAVAVAFNFWALPRLPVTRFLVRDGHDDGHRGLVLYPAGLLFLILLFRDTYAPVQAGWLALALGDGLAPGFGRWFSRPRWPWCPDKAVPASVLAFAVSGSVMGLLIPWPGAVAGAVAGLLAETLPGEDNLAVPLFAAAGVALTGVVLTGGAA
ncbi:MAG: hypothetical protein CMJ83_00670 [Planctomycetes bacterium]|nr:hypothetical protein [Planctomycetota bacterium]